MKALSSTDTDELFRALEDHAPYDLLEQARHHIAALEADNAALLSAVLDVYGVAKSFHWDEAADDAPETAIWQAILHPSCAPHPGTAYLEEHRKALVRARNEGLEKAAAVFDGLASDAEDEGDADDALHAKDWATRIRSMKEPES